jgi:malate synthase
LYQSIFDEEVVKIRHLVGEGNLHNTKFEEAIALFDKLVRANEFEEFLTIKAYNEI